MLPIWRRAPWGSTLPESGYSFASFLLGANNNSQTPEGLPLTFPRANRFGAYIQDDWKVSSKLTVNLGLRFDYNGVPVDDRGTLANSRLRRGRCRCGSRRRVTRPPTAQPFRRCLRHATGESGAIQAVQAGCEVFHASHRHCLSSEREVGFSELAEAGSTTSTT